MKIIQKLVITLLAAVSASNFYAMEDKETSEHKIAFAEQQMANDTYSANIIMMP